jgi:hypothetical protein
VISLQLKVKCTDCSASMPIALAFKDLQRTKICPGIKTYVYIPIDIISLLGLGVRY